MLSVPDFTHTVLAPVEMLEKLAALVPAPKAPKV
jgi:hypothetical protein